MPREIPCRALSLTPGERSFETIDKHEDPVLPGDVLVIHDNEGRVVARYTSHGDFGFRPEANGTFTPWETVLGDTVASPPQPGLEEILPGLEEIMGAIRELRGLMDGSTFVKGRTIVEDTVSGLPPLATVEEVARALRKSKKTVMRLINRRELRALPATGRGQSSDVRIPRASVAQYVERHLTPGKSG